MRLMPFLCLILVMTAGWMNLYSRVREIFNGVSDYKSEITKLKEQRELEHQTIALEREEFLEFRQNIASLMPDVLKEKGIGVEGYPYRSLASTISRGDSDQVRATIVKTLFERAKERFHQKEFVKAERLFQSIIEKYGFTPYVVESMFLLGESLFQQGKLEECTMTIQRMVELFPHHELTGFALVRLGRIYELQNRNEEAIDIYKTVLRSYPQRDVASQAKASLKGVDL